MGGLIDQMEQIARSPASGRAIAGLPSRFRRVPYGSHFIFYTIHEQHVRIVRILHQRMDAARHLN
jgi:toxin ParE1/3/4